MLALICTVALLSKPSLFQMDEQQVDAFLAELHARQWPFSQRIDTVATAFLGAPYKDGPLGEGAGGRYDTDPLIDLSCADCVTFVEQTLALAVSKSYSEAARNLQQIRYNNGQIDFETRNHFMVADWIAHNTWCRDVTRDLGVPVTALTRTISKRAFFPKVNAPELGPNTPDREMTIAYVPLDRVSQAIEKLPSPSLILLIGKMDWLFAVHCGFFLRAPDGAPRFIHASSKAGKVIKDDLAAYLDGSTRHLGFTAYKIEDPPLAQP